MSAAAWYPDPTQPGRLRYWDGTRWTEHISTDGRTERAAIEGIAPAPPNPADAVGATAGDAVTGTTADAPPATATATPAVGGGFGSNSTPGGPTLLGRLGFLIGAAGGVLTAFTTGKVAAEQTDPFHVTITVGGGAWLGIVAAVVCIAGAISPWFWGRVAAASIGWVLGAFIAFAVVGFRTDEIFSTGSGASDVTFGTAGWLMFLGSILLMVGNIIAIYLVRNPVRAVDPGAVANPREGKGISALICGIVGLIIPVAAPAAVGLGLATGDDNRASEGRAGGAKLGITGIILGTVALVLWTISLFLAMLLAKP